MVMVTKCSIIDSRALVVLEMEGEESGRGFSVCYIENLSYICVHEVHTRACIVQMHT